MGATVNGGRVLICDPGCPRELIRDILPQADVGTVADAGPGIVALLVSPEAPVTAADIARAPDLAMIATASVGTDHIDLAAAAARGIAVANVPDYCIEEVSDHALAMVLALRRGLVAGDRSVQAGRWDWTAVGALGRLQGTRTGRRRDGPDRPPPGREGGGARHGRAPPRPVRARRRRARRRCSRGPTPSRCTCRSPTRRAA